MRDWISNTAAPVASGSETEPRPECHERRRDHANAMRTLQEIKIPHRGLGKLPARGKLTLEVDHDDAAGRLVVFGFAATRRPFVRLRQRELRHGTFPFLAVAGPLTTFNLLDDERVEHVFVRLRVTC